MSRLAIPALRNLLGDPGLLQSMQAIRGYSFNGRDVLTGYLRNRQRTGPNRGSIEMHRTSATQAGATTEFSAGEIERVAKNPKQRGVRGNAYFVFAAIYAKSDVCHVAKIKKDMAVILSKTMKKVKWSTPREIAFWHAKQTEPST